MDVGQVLKKKGGALHAVEADLPISGVIERFATSRVRSFLVIEGERLVGILTIRDVLNHLDKRGEKAFVDTAAEAMTRDLVTVTTDTPLRDVEEMFLENRFNHIPVVDGFRAIGVLTLRDILGERVRESERTNEYLRAYISGGYW